MAFYWRNFSGAHDESPRVAPERAPSRAAREAAEAGTRTHRTRVYIVSECTDFKPPYSAGGTERQLSDLAVELGRCNVEVTVVVRERRSGMSGPVVSAGDDRFRTFYVPPGPVAKGQGWSALLPNLRFIGNTFLFLLRARRDYDVLIVSGFRQLALPIAFLSGLVRKRCIVRIETSWDLDDQLSPESNARIGRLAQLLTSTVIRAARRMTFALADDVIAFSDPLEERLAELGAPPEKIKQVPNGVDVAQFVPVSSDAKRGLRRRLGLPLDKTIFVYTGRICRSKGVLEILRVWQRCMQRGDLFLLLVGSGSNSHESCEREARELAERYPGRIKLTGSVENVAQYLQASDVFIFLSHNEAFGLSILEAIASGLPCLVSDVGCARQLIRHHENGSIVPVHAEPSTVLGEIAWLQSQRERWGSMGARARAQIVKSHALRAVAHRYVDLFDPRRPHRRTGSDRA